MLWSPSRRGGGADGFYQGDWLVQPFPLAISSRPEVFPLVLFIPLTPGELGSFHLRRCPYIAPISRASSELEALFQTRDLNHHLTLPAMAEVQAVYYPL